MIKKPLDVYLVSDSSGETVIAVSKATLVQFPDYDCKEHHFLLVRTEDQVNNIVDDFNQRPGIIIYTMGNGQIKNYFLSLCKEFNIPAICALESVVSFISSTISADPSDTKPGKYKFLDRNYYARINSVNFAISHDDGQNAHEYEQADIVLFGVSRTSKSPTSFYLAQRGYNVANYPIVQGLQINIPNLQVLLDRKKPIFVGLTMSIYQLAMVRNSRQSMLCKSNIEISKAIMTGYSSDYALKEEIESSDRFFRELQIAIVDVTNKAVEEVAAEIINLHNASLCHA